MLLFSLNNDSCLHFVDNGRCCTSLPKVNRPWDVVRDLEGERELMKASRKVVDGGKDWSHFVNDLFFSSKVNGASSLSASSSLCPMSFALPLHAHLHRKYWHESFVLHDD